MQRTATVLIKTTTKTPTRIFINDELFIDDVLHSSSKYTFTYLSTLETDQITLTNLQASQTHDLPTTNHIII